MIIELAIIGLGTWISGRTAAKTVDYVLHHVENHERRSTHIYLGREFEALVSDDFRAIKALVEIVNTLSGEVARKLDLTEEVEGHMRVCIVDGVIAWANTGASINDALLRALPNRDLATKYALPLSEAWVRLTPSQRNQAYRAGQLCLV